MDVSLCPCILNHADERSHCWFFLPLRFRVSVPLGDEAAIAVGQLLGAEHMIEMVARARRRAVGSMFPSVSSSSSGGGMGSRTPG